MPVPPTEVVEDAVRTLRDGGDDAELLMLIVPVGTPSHQRAALLSGVSDLVTAIRARGVPVKVLRVSGHGLERRGIDVVTDIEALFVLHTGEAPELPPERDETA